MVHEPGLHTWLPLYAEENPFHLWVILDEEQRQHVREEVVQSIGPACSAHDRGFTIECLPENRLQRRTLFNILDAWWNEASWDSSPNEFQMAIGKLVEQAMEETIGYGPLKKEMLERVEKEEWPIPTIVIDWILEHVATTRQDW